jgi:hypothetical protein
MEDETTSENSGQGPAQESNQIPEVYILRSWKEYAGESLLIVFSVLLAIILTEYINNQHEKSDTKDLLNNIRTELKTNQQKEKEQYAYQQRVLKSIDSAINDPKIQAKIIANDEFHLKLIAPRGVLYRYLDDIAWEVAKNHNISSKISLNTISVLTHIYQDQVRIMKVEDEIAKIILSRDAQKQQNARETLILIRDNYKGWAVDRAPGLLYQYNKAIKLLSTDD